MSTLQSIHQANRALQAVQTDTTAETTAGQGDTPQKFAQTARTAVEVRVH